ncbi:hypothetical protein V2I01_32920 [Micromonospora sp. BRA006-A]|nr:hypothetical protein [Micromonospora sp. BRA006-A]
MPEEYLHDLRVVSSVLPFKVNQYVVDELIDWSAVPDDPIFRLTFPHRDMLPPEIFDHLSALHLSAAEPGVIRKAARDAHARLNPNPGAHREANVPAHRDAGCSACSTSTPRRCWSSRPRGRPVTPTAATASAGRSSSRNAEIRRAASDVGDVVAYLEDSRGVTDVLFTGGDPMIMSAAVLERWVSPCWTRPSTTSARCASAPRRCRTGRPGSPPTRTPTTCCASSSGSPPPAGTSR